MCFKVTIFWQTQSLVNPNGQFLRKTLSLTVFGSKFPSNVKDMVIMVEIIIIDTLLLLCCFSFEFLNSLPLLSLLAKIKCEFLNSKLLLNNENNENKTSIFTSNICYLYLSVIELISISKTGRQHIFHATKHSNHRMYVENQSDLANY